MASRKIRGGIYTLFLILLSFFIFSFFSRLEPKADWLIVEATSPALSGHPLDIRVTIKELAEPVFLFIDLTWYGKNRERQGGLGSARPKERINKAGAYDFSFDLPEKGDFYYVSAMIHLTPSGSWQDRIAAANTQRIRISSGSSPPPLSSLRKVKVKQGTSASEEMRQKVQNREDRFQRIHETPLPFRIFLFAILSSMGLLTMSSSRKRIPEKTKKWGRYLWIGFGIILFAASFAELFELQKHAISLGRGIARYIGLYWSRRSFQAALIAAFIAGGIGLIFLFLRAWKKSSGRRELWWTGLGIAGYFSISLVSLLSFHHIDVIGSTALLGISLFDAVKGASLVIALTGLLSEMPQLKKGVTNGAKPPSR